MENRCTGRNETERNVPNCSGCRWLCLVFMELPGISLLELDALCGGVEQCRCQLMNSCDSPPLSDKIRTKSATENDSRREIDKDWGTRTDGRLLFVVSSEEETTVARPRLNKLPDKRISAGRRWWSVDEQRSVGIHSKLSVAHFQLFGQLIFNSTVAAACPQLHSTLWLLTIQLTPD